MDGDLFLSGGIPQPRGREGARMGSRSQWAVDKTEAVSPDGMVCAMQPDAAEAGAEILRRGGNAVDAAVTTAFAVGVVEPFMSGIGGVAWMTYRDAASGRSTCLDASSTLPRAIKPDTFELLEPDQRSGLYGWRATKDDAANTGWLSPVAPGVPALLGEAHERFGRLPWRDLVAPAIALAEGGFEVNHYVASMLSASFDRLSRFPESRHTFIKPNGAPFAPAFGRGPGDRLVQRDLAHTLRLIAEEGWTVVYCGEIADRLAAEMKQNGGLLDAEELASYRVRVLEPTAAEYRGYQLLGPLENTGYATLIEALNILEGFDVGRLGRQSLDAIHLKVESIRRAFLDRLTYLGDSASMPVPYGGVISRDFAATRRATIDPARATPNEGAGDPWPYDPSSAPVGQRERMGSGGEGQTTHITVIDREHNMVSLTATLGDAFGSAIVIKDTGIVLNNGTMWFDPEPGSVTSIAPGKRLMTAASPTLILRESQPFAAIGSPGGRQVISALFQCIANLIDFGDGMQAAISAPRIHSEGRETSVSNRFPSDIIDGLRDLGHQVAVRDDVIGTSWFGRPNGVLVDQKTGVLYGGAFQLTPATAVGV